MDEPFIVNLARDQAQDLPKASTYADLIKGGIFIVTGSNTGLGFEAASALVATGAAKVILAVRSQQRGDAAVKNIEEITGFTGVAEVWLLNMASYDSIVAFGERVKTLDKINGISLNAGVVQDQWTVADRGNEMTNMVNVLGTVLLAGLILPTLRQMAAKLGRKTHLSLVGSGTAFQKESDIELEKAVASGRDVIDYFNDEKNMSISRYGLSKLLVTHAIRALARLNPVSSTGVVINVINPGMCNTDIDRGMAAETRAVLKVWREQIGRSAEMGSRTLVHGLVAGESTHGKFVSECEVKEHYVPEFIRGVGGRRIEGVVWESVRKHANEVVPAAL